MTDEDKQLLEKIGLRFRAKRNDLYYSLRDLSHITGISTGTLNGIEKGKDLTFTNFLTLCRSLEIQPALFFQPDIIFKSPYSLPPEAQERITLSKKLDSLVYQSDFFDTERRVSDVLIELGVDKSESNKFSVYLSNYCEEGTLVYRQHGNFKTYRKKTREKR